MGKVGKIIISLVSVLVSYLISYYALSSLFSPQPQATMMGLVSQNPNALAIHIVSILIALIAGVLVAAQLGLLAQAPAPATAAKRPAPKQAKPKRAEIDIVMKALKADEKKLVEEVRKAGEITQDSLRFRLGWSKAKLSTLLSNLDRLGIVQCERSGKTYRVSVQKQLRKRF